MESEQTKQASSSTIEDELNKIRDRFIEERDQWKDRVREMAERMKNIHDLAELQVDLFTSRQEAVEYQYNITMSVARLDSRLSKKKKALIVQLNDMDVRYGKIDMNNIIDGECADHNFHINLLKSHSGYMHETVRTIDNMIFGIKHRLELENFRTR